MKKTIFVCDNCGAESAKWAGKCLQCGEWNSLKQLTINSSKVQGRKARASEPIKLSKVKSGQFDRLKTGIGEFDLVLGGGFVPGSVVLLGGEPGIGKSTLILQVASKLKDVLYVSGEESLEQIKNRADRLKIQEEIKLLDETDIDSIIATLEKEKPALAIIDSIQSVDDESVDTSAGSISQLKSCGLKLLRFAKDTGISILIIGHINKEGLIAGPKTLEHMVDTVLYLEGERFHTLRILRTTKNRYGNVAEAGIFEMTARGLVEAKGMAKELLAQRVEKSPGSSLTVVMEGTRPFLLEIQALASKTSFGYPQRKSSGFDMNRLQLILAVLSAILKVNVGYYDVIMNVIGGFKIGEPAADLAAALAIISAIKKRPLKKDLVAFGELGLSGEIRTVYNFTSRVKEAKSLGFKKILAPKFQSIRLTDNDKTFKIIQVGDIGEAIKIAVNS